jgi:hypothetical protein
MCLLLFLICFLPFDPFSCILVAIDFEVVLRCFFNMVVSILNLVVWGLFLWCHFVCLLELCLC